MDKKHENVELVNESKSKNLLTAIYDFFHDLFDIKTGLDWVGTVTEIRKKVALKGEQVWMLIAATMIASGGLNMNSAAVIIGAMLISPLMSPILGIGLGVGINDRQLLNAALKNFAVAVIAVILTSALFFWITPFEEVNNQITSRTQPNLIDAIIAIFGGTAGIVAISRKEKGAAIPGVAIATALLPPLAVSGYGLAHGNWQFFLGSFYLFFLNSFLIAFATYLIVRFLGFPYKQHRDEKAKKRTSIIISIIALAFVLPSVFILVKQKQRIDRDNAVFKYINSHFNEGENDIRSKIELESLESDSIALYKFQYRGVDYNDSILAVHEKALSEIVGKPTLIDPVLLILSDRQQAIYAAEKDKMSTTIDEKTARELSYQKQIKDLEHAVDSLREDEKLFKKLETDLKALYPNIDEVGFSYTYRRDYNQEKNIQEPVLLVKWERGVSRSKRNDYEKQMQRYLDEQEGLKDTKIIRTN